MQGGTRKKMNAKNDIKEFLLFSAECYLFISFFAPSCGCG
jgi:hypothetical protein